MFPDWDMSGRDAITNGIDRAFDSLHRFVDGAAIILGVDTREEAPKSIAVDHAKIIEVRETKTLAAGTEALSVKPGSASSVFTCVIEKTADGREVYTVTNGHERAECPNADTAATVMALLMKAGK